MSGLLDLLGGGAGLPALPTPSVTPNAAAADPMSGLLPQQPVAPQSPLLPTANYGQQLGKLSMLQQLHMLVSNPKDTLMAAAKGLPGAVGDMLVGDTGAMGDFLTPEDKHAAQMRALQHFGIAMLANSGPVVGAPAPTLGQSIARGLLAGEQAGTQTAQGLAEQRVQMMPMQHQMQILRARQMIGEMYGPSADDTPEQITQKLMRAYSAYSAVGDTDMMKSLGDVIKELPAFKGMDPMNIDTGSENVLIDKHTGRVLGTLPRGMNPDQRQAHADSVNIANANLALASQGQALRRDALNETQAQRLNTNTNSVIDDFRSDTQDWQRVRAAYDVLRAGAANPNLAQPIAMIDGLGRIFNPRAQVRPSMVEILHQMGSLGDRVQRWMSVNKTGNLPPQMVNEMMQMGQAVLRNHRDQYRTARGAAIKRGLGMGITNIDSLLPDYDVQLPGDAPAAGARGATTTSTNPLLK